MNVFDFGMLVYDHECMRPMYTPISLIVYVEAYIYGKNP